jgi:hypothetical protein
VFGVNLGGVINGVVTLVPRIKGPVQRHGPVMSDRGPVLGSWVGPSGCGDGDGAGEGQVAMLQVEMVCLDELVP